MGNCISLSVEIVPANAASGELYWPLLSLNLGDSTKKCSGLGYCISLSRLSLNLKSECIYSTLKCL